MNNEHVLTVRAIAGAYAKQLLLPVVIMAVSVVTLCWIISVILIVRVSPWWGINLLLLLPMTLLLCAFCVVIFKATRMLIPPLTTPQKKAATRFVEKTGTYSSLLGMSRYMIAWAVIRHIIMNRKSDSSALETLLNNSSELKDEYNNIRKGFKKHDRVVVENSAT